MKHVLSMVMIILLTGCASLKSDVFQKVHEGTTADRVLGVLGEPDDFKPSSKYPGGFVWTYYKRGDSCSITLLDHQVVARGCSSGASGTEVLAGVLGSMGKASAEGLKSTYSSQPRPVSCTTSPNGIGGYTTDCQ